MLLWLKGSNYTLEVESGIGYYIMMMTMMTMMTLVMVAIIVVIIHLIEVMWMRITTKNK